MLKHLFLSSLLVFCLQNAALANNAPSMLILPFKNITQNPADNWLQESFSENLTMGLGQLETLKLVERAEVKRILKEQNFSQSAFVDTESAPQMGKMVGAKYVVLGNYQKIGGQILVNVRVVNTETGTIESSSLTQVKGNYNNLFNLQEQLAQKLIQKLDLAFSTENKRELKQALATTDSTQAHEHYIKARLLREQLGDKNIQKSVALLRLALTEDDRYARAAVELAGVYLDRANGQEVYKSYTPQDLTLAEKYAHQAIALAPNSTEGYRVLAEVFAAQNKRPEALKMAQKALSIEKNTASILAYIKLKYPIEKAEVTKTTAAEVENELKVLGADFEDAQILFTLGGLYFSEIHTRSDFDIDKALAFYEKAHIKNPHNPFYAFTLSAVHLLQGNVERAKNILTPVLEENPDSIALIISGSEAGQRLLPDLGKINNEALQNKRYPDYTLAYFHLATLYLQQEKTNPDNIILLLSGARELKRLMPESVLKWTRQAIDLAPHTPEVYFQLADLYLQQQKDLQQADLWFKKGLPFIKNSPNAAYSASRYLIKRGKYAAAETQLNKALGIWKTAADQGNKAASIQYHLSLNTWAQLQVKQNKDTAALNAYRNIVVSNLPPLQKGIAYQRMAEIYAGQKKFRLASESYQLYLKWFPKNLQGAATDNIYQGYFAEQSLEKAPNDPLLLNDAGQAYLTRGEYDKALLYLKKAKRLAPKNATIYYNLGRRCCIRFLENGQKMLQSKHEYNVV